MSSDWNSHVGKSFPSANPTLTAHASLAFKMENELLPARGVAVISRLSCADPDVIDCFKVRDLPNRSIYHNSIDPDEYNVFKKPGRSGTNTLRVFTDTLPCPTGSYEGEITPGESEGHDFRYARTTAIFSAALDEDGGWRTDVPLTGWVRLHGTLDVWVANVPSISITQHEELPASAVTDRKSRFGEDQGGLQVPKGALH